MEARVHLTTQETFLKQKSQNYCKVIITTTPPLKSFKNPLLQHLLIKPTLQKTFHTRKLDNKTICSMKRKEIMN